MILADTSVWIPYLRNEARAEVHEFRVLLRAGEVVMTGMVMAEILQGLRRGEDLAEYSRLLRSFPFLETNSDDWMRAGRLSQDLRRLGQTTPLSDLVIGCVAIRNDVPLLHRDEHFGRIPGLRLLLPGNDTR